MRRDNLRQPVRGMLLVSAAMLTSVLALHCSSSDSKPDPLPTGVATLTMTASPSRLPADGTSTDVTLVATNPNGTPGVGTVTIAADHGSLQGAEQTSTSVILGNGRASFKYACDVNKDAECVGTQTIKGRWLMADGDVTLTLTQPTETPDAGDAGDGSDGESDASDGSPDDGSPEGSTEEAGADAGDGGDAADADANTSVVSLTSSRPKIFASTGDFATLTATVRTRPDGGTVSNEPVEFTATVGVLALPDGGALPPGQPLVVTTDNSGVAVAELHDNGQDGNAVVTARDTTTGSSAQTSVQITSIQMAYVGTSCGTATNCTLMGVFHSGFHEQAQVSFKVTDVAQNAAPGVAVRFSVSDQNLGLSINAQAVTNAQGIATAQVSSGPNVGAFTVHAVAVDGAVEADSPTIGVRGSIPSNRAFSLNCAKVPGETTGNFRLSVPAFSGDHPPSRHEVDCRLTVVDRFNNRVGSGRPVYMKTEAGAVPDQVTPNLYNPTGANNEEGQKVVTFNSDGTWPPVDVEPLPGEPVNPADIGSTHQRNPRDGLVTIIAYVQGEEYYHDTNSNGVWDVGEPFIDQGEPFVDANDNGQFDFWEDFVDVPPKNNQYDGPNGRWDSDLYVWTEEHLLMTGAPELRHLVPSSFGTVPLNQPVYMDAFFLDERMNPMAAGSTRVPVSHTITRGTVVWDDNNNALDPGYGCRLEHVLVNTTDGSPCGPATPICVWTNKFSNWDTGLVGRVRLSGASNPAAGSPFADTVTVSVQLDATYSIRATGFFE